MDDSLAGDLELVLTRLARQLRTGHVPVEGVSWSSVSLLAATAELGRASTPGAVAAAERISSTVATRALTRLTAAGLISRRSSRGDRRHIHLRLTPKGRRALAVARRSTTHPWQQYLHRLTASEQAVVRNAIDVLERLHAGAPEHL